MAERVFLVVLPPCPKPLTCPLTAGQGNILYILDMRMVYTVAMKRGELKIRIEQVLREKGPMKSAEIAAELGEDQRTVAHLMKSMSMDGSIYVVKRDRKRANTWAVPNWWVGRTTDIVIQERGTGRERFEEMRADAESRSPDPCEGDGTSGSRG